MVANRATAESYDVLPCDRVITIPQYIGTCWFNALLMTIFYSEAMRDVVIAAMDSRWRRLQRSPNAFTRRLAQYFEHMLRLYKRPKDQWAYKFYDKITPERILYYLHKADPKRMEYDAVTKDRRTGKYVLREGMSAGYNVYMYARKFLRFLQVQTVAFTAVPIVKGDKRGPFRLSIGDVHSRSHVNFARHKQRKKNAYSYSIRNPKYVRSLMDSRPEVLIVDIGDSSRWRGTKRPDYYYLPGEHRSLPSFIRLRNATYVLDSCVLINDNSGERAYASDGKIVTVSKHAIAGVTCSRRKFIYSGWMKKTVDKARGTSKQDRGGRGGLAATNRPCPLMPFDWSKDPRGFYITSKVCRVQFAPPNPSSVRFNAVRGPRTYFYVRRDHVHYKRHAIQRLKHAAKSGDKARAVRLGFSVAKQTVADALRRKARIDRAAGISIGRRRR